VPSKICNLQEILENSKGCKDDWLTYGDSYETFQDIANRSPS